MPQIEIANKHVMYKFEIQGKYSIICGDSGTGKTTLCDLITAANINTVGVINKSDTPLMVLPLDSVDIDPKRVYNRVVFIDERALIMHNGMYEKQLKECDCFFVFIIRTVNLSNLPISAESVYEMHSSGKFHTLRPMYKPFKRQQLSEVDAIIVEDSNSGYEFIKQLTALSGCNTGVVCTTAKGNTKIIHKIHEMVQAGYKHFVLVYDAAAIGMLLTGIVACINRLPNCTFFVVDWQSFEHYILASDVFGEKYNLKSIGCMHESLEQFATERLKQLMPKYNKKQLPICLRYNACTQCKNTAQCTCVNYDFNKYIYDTIRQLYTFLKKLPQVQMTGISGVTYAYFVQCNHAAKTACVQQWRIDETNFAQNVCKVASNDKTSIVSATALVQHVLAGKIAVTNPSVFRNWVGFVSEC